MQADFILDYDVLTVEQPHKLYLMAHLKADPAPDDQRRRPLNLSVAIDKSGSMAGDKLDYTRQAAQFLVQNLGMNDILSIVLYSDRVEPLLMPEKVQRKDIINQRIASIKAGGTTNLSSGWLEACNLVARNKDESYVNRVILMSDGLANRGVTNSEQIINMVQQKYVDGVSTTTMGLGEDFNEDLMMAMASAGGGAFYFIESPEVAPLIFQEELSGLLRVVGQNLTISIEPTAHVTTVNQLNAYPVSTDGKKTSFRLGDLFGDEVKALILELAIPGLHDIGQMQIATLYFEYDDLTGDQIVRRSWEMPVNINVTEDAVEQSPNPEVQQSVLLLHAAEARRRAVKVADKGDFNSASRILRDIADSIEKSGMDSERLLEERNALRQQADDIQQGVSNYSKHSRKMMSTQAFYTMNSRHDDTVMLRGRDAKREEPQRRTQSVPAAPRPTPDIDRQPGVTPTHVTWNGQTFPLQGDIIRVGRSRHNEITIGGIGVSRFHCQLRRDGNSILIEDLGSTNGTRVDDDTISAPFPLSVGDTVYLCDEKLIFHDGSL